MKSSMAAATHGVSSRNDYFISHNTDYLNIFPIPVGVLLTGFRCIVSNRLNFIDCYGILDRIGINSFYCI